MALAPSPRPAALGLPAWCGGGRQHGEAGGLALGQTLAGASPHVLLATWSCPHFPLPQEVPRPYSSNLQSLSFPCPHPLTPGPTIWGKNPVSHVS